MLNRRQLIVGAGAVAIAAPAIVKLIPEVASVPPDDTLWVGLADQKTDSVFKWMKAAVKEIATAEHPSVTIEVVGDNKFENWDQYRVVGIRVYREKHHLFTVDNPRHLSPVHMTVGDTLVIHSLDLTL